MHRCTDEGDVWTLPHQTVQCWQFVLEITVQRRPKNNLKVAQLTLFSEFNFLNLTSVCSKFTVISQL